MLVAPPRAAPRPFGGAATSGGADALTTLLAPTCSGCWAHASGTHLPAYSGPLAAAIRGNTGPVSVMSTWSGATLDTSAERLIVWGGGHTDYTGNEVYAFSLTNLTWAELTLPSNPAGYGGTSGTMPDGNPASRHTYDGLIFLPSNKKMLSVGGAIATNGFSDGHAWKFDTVGLTWALTSNNPALNGECCGQLAAYDSGTTHVFSGNNLQNGIIEYDPGADTWSAFGSTTLTNNTSSSAAVDPIDEIMVSVGGGAINYVELTGVNKGTVHTPAVSGDTTLQNATAPGFVWHAGSGKFVGWNGGTTVYLLTPVIGGTWISAAHTVNVANTVTPLCSDAGDCSSTTGHSNNGTFGRWQYDTPHNTFAAVNTIDDDLYFYKPDF